MREHDYVGLFTDRIRYLDRGKIILWIQAIQILLNLSFPWNQIKSIVRHYRDSTSNVRDFDELATFLGPFAGYMLHF